MSELSCEEIKCKDSYCFSINVLVIKKNYRNPHSENAWMWAAVLLTTAHSANRLLTIYIRIYR